MRCSLFTIFDSRLESHYKIKIAIIDMTDTIKTIHLLLAEPSSNQAEIIINALRNRGFAVRATQVLTSEELSDSLEKGSSDLFLSNIEHKDLPTSQVIELINSYGRDIPCIVLLPKHDDEQLIKVMNLGAKDAVTFDNLSLLILKIEREIQALETRRSKTKTELLLKATEKRCTLLLDNSQDAIAYVHDGMHVYANNTYMELFGYEDHDELMCVPALDMISKESQNEFRQYLKGMSETREQQSFSFSGVKSDFSQFDAVMTLSTANYDDEVCTQLLIRSAADNAELEEKLKELSSLDTLTELYNKNYFIDQLQQAIEQAAEKGDTANVLFIDYHQHSQLLDEYGITGADKITQDCAKWLSEESEENYNLARIGDNTFAMLVPNNAEQKAKTLAQNLCHSIKKHLFDIEGHTIKLTLKIGICAVSEDFNDPDQLMSNAHQAANRVEKGSGVKVYNKTIHEVSDKEDMELLDKIHDALESKRVKLLYQPVVKLHGDPRELYQVLVRVTDENGEPLDSSKIFHVAKAAGMGEQLDLWIIKQSFKILIAQGDNDKSQLFVSLSGGSLVNSQLVTIIDKAFRSSGLRKNRIIFQIDESDAVNHLKRVLVFCAELKQKGYKTCLANYGADPSQKTLLEQLDVNYVKVYDKITSQINKDPAAAEQVQSLLDDIHSRDKQSIIPKVEEAAMLAALWPMNVRYIQGYYLKRPGSKLDYDFSSSGF